MARKLDHVAFSSLLKAHLDEFDAASKLHRPIIALDILNEWRRMHQGRLVKLDKKRNLWNDIGDRKGRELIGKSLKKMSEEKRNASLPSIHLQKNSKDDTAVAVKERDAT
eukprot:CAMPEP_0178929724 /NCGR_PEP_ID=MMETSP0786-20121207/20791_1 /TAXON_ID=186022 /ORGANISM="Thalassionema frauenfeldii, Strain CCMP 1798" /LENGTH=109 /DNA_ID=CAMNT_0020606077 /DNA_START=233 /DNA_END=559 /DNA_ORIENTATION=+